MAFKDIHKLKKIAVVEKENISTSHLIVGKDIFALSLYYSLKNKFGDDKVRLLSEDIIFEADLFPKGPSTIRGKSNIEFFKQNYPHAITFEGSSNSLFYKDMSFKNFGGRSKSEALKHDEEFYTTPCLHLDYKKIFSELGDVNSYIESANNISYKVKVKEIEKTNNGFNVECINGTLFTTEHLYFANSPDHFYKLYKNKNELSDNFISFCESTNTIQALFVKFIFDRPITDIKETIFIPLSYTHEWGHFIGEFIDNNGKQEAEFMHFIDEDHTSEEDISRTIRHLKKSLEKIFDNYLKINSKDLIALEREIGCLKIDDSLYENPCDTQQNDWNNFYFIGINAPIIETQDSKEYFEYSKTDLSFMARGLVTYKESLKKFDLGVLTNNSTQLNIY